MPNLKMERRNTWTDYYGNGKTFRIPMQRYFCWAAVMCSLCLLAKADDCPVYCTCRENTGTVTCQSLLERTVPSDLPQWANTLIVRGYNITTLFKGTFSSNSTELVNLSLSENHIQTIEANAFSGLTQLEMLDLSHNLLASIAADAFNGLRNLKILELSGNQLKTMAIANLDDLNLEELVLTNNSIQTVGEEDVSSLYEHNKMQVFLALNPFKCNCELQSFYDWLKNSSQCRDASLLLCSDPESKKGIPIEKLRTEDCTNTDLEAVSYVFLSIVLALIGVVFLMVLYLNGEGIKRWLNNIREACRDQMEVYHYRYEQDSDPRLANVAV